MMTPPNAIAEAHAGLGRRRKPDLANSSAQAPVRAGQARWRCAMALVAMGWVGAVLSASAASVTLTFDDVGSLAEYAPLGVTFSANASRWSAGGPSVLQDPNGGARSLPSALQFGNAGGVLGSISFASNVSAVSIWALSGPGPDLLSAGIYIRAFDANGVQLGEDVGNATLQFDLLSVAAPGIRRLDVFSPVVGTEVWDDLTVEWEPVVRPLVLRIGLEGALARLSWGSQTNADYQLQYQTELGTNGWVDLGKSIPGNGTTNWATDGIGGLRRFYRLRAGARGGS